MSELFNKLSSINIDSSVNKYQILNEVKKYFVDAGYGIFEIWGQKPWGAYIRFENNDAEKFIKEFFPGLSLEEVTLGNINSELSPKILIVAPGKRLSWQWHSRRTEIWTFLNGGYYAKSPTDDEVELQTANAGDIVKLNALERHRLVGHDAKYTIVAEIWSHTEANHISDEDDIVRLQDDYNR